MKKYLTFIRKLAWLICLCTFALSCDQASQPPAKPKVVREKIMAQKDQQTTSRIVKKKVAEAPKQQPEKASSQTQAASPTSVVEKDKPKPAISPKSDISAPAKATGARPAESGEKMLTADTQAASKAFAAETKTPPGGTQLDATQLPRYNPKGKVDPFEPLFKQRAAVAKPSKKKRKKRIPRTPLERIDLSQLKLVAIVLAKSGNRAMVEEASGKGYIISKGTYIGTNAGQVTQIQRNKVIVAEEIEDVMGNVSVRKTELKLPKPPGDL
jgi:type IV pilus assembly protein PilP